VNTTELKDYLNAIIDEDDNTFITESQRNLFLKLGYDEFRNIIYAESPGDVVSTADFTLSGVDVLNLATTLPDGGGAGSELLGANANNPMLKLWKVAKIDSTGDVDYFFDIVPSEESVPMNYNLLVGSPTVWLEGTQLRIGGDTSATIRLYYLKSNTVDFSSPSAFIDDFAQFHHIIALFAAKHYSIMDNGVNQQLEEKTIQFEKRMREFFQTTRSPSASSFVEV